MPSELPAASPPSPRVARRATVLRPFLALLGIGCLLALATGGTTSSAARLQPSASAATVIALAVEGYHTEPAAIHWVDPPHVRRGWPFDNHRFVVTAQRNSEPTDVWLGYAILSPEGRFIRLSSLYNMSDTSAVSETDLTVRGERIAWSLVNDDQVVSIHVRDLNNRPPPTNSDMTTIERWQTRLTYLQETGQLAGVCRRAFRFRSPQPSVTLAFTDSGLMVETRDKVGTLNCDDRVPEALGVEVEPAELASPGDLVTWAVDRVRALSWFGTDRMQLVKAVAFGAWERFDSVKRRVVKSDSNQPLTDEVGDVFSTDATHAPEPVAGWPPAPITPILTPPLPTEGEFHPLDTDPFAIPPGGGPSPFALAFVRADPSRQESRVFVTLWDPRRIELHTMTGTREPKTATGETGSGTVPRDREVVGRLAGAFNGGFQATHGEFGMMAQRIVYLPPKPYAATIAERVDGTVALGTWPNDDSIPNEIIGFRQNLTPLLSDGKVNPYARTWWGGVPPGWEDATRTVRTGLCLTADSFMAYFYGSAISADHLAKAMVSARCNYGVHLDMNPGHTGFEFYRVAPSGTLPKLPHKLDPTWETRGEVAGAPGLEFIGRRMLRTMHLMHFPRYVRTDSRDFFYLTHRHVLPPPTPEIQVGGDMPALQFAWQTQTSAQEGYPAASATTRLKPEPTRPELEIAVVALDGKWLTPCVTNCPESPVIARSNRTSQGKGRGLFYLARRFVVADQAPTALAIPIAFGADESHATKAVALLGIAHGDWLFHAEVVRGADRVRDVAVLKRVLAALGCTEVVFLDRSIDLSVGARAGESHGAITWLRDASPMAARMFNDTPVVAPSVWQPLQSKRIRYVPQRSRVTEQRTTRRADIGDDAPSVATPVPATTVPSRTPEGP